ncbi:hypothetical protein [Luteolibacter sp. AS25]|uniref:hypothetical protein n=1 Tax=Luteolibacter sp. AS25 TaxID=3135776 RepID=UPI00398B600B
MAVAPSEALEQLDIRAGKKGGATGSSGTPLYFRQSHDMPSGEPQEEGWRMGVAHGKGEDFVFFEHKYEDSKEGYPHEIENDLENWTHTLDLETYFERVSAGKA